MSGLKSRYSPRTRQRTLSHPVWDEWIEISISSSEKKEHTRLIPFGMSGLKFEYYQNGHNGAKVSSRLG